LGVVIAWAKGVITGVFPEDVGVSSCKGVVTSKLDGGREGVAVLTRQSTDTEGGWAPVRYDDGLPNTAFAMEGEVEIGPFSNEASLRIEKRGGGTWEDETLFFIRKRFPNCLAR